MTCGRIVVKKICAEDQHVKPQVTGCTWGAINAHKDTAVFAAWISCSFMRVHCN